MTDLSHKTIDSLREALLKPLQRGSWMIVFSGAGLEILS
jgi:hypothetical protein